MPMIKCDIKSKPLSRTMNERMTPGNSMRNWMVWAFAGELSTAVKKLTRVQAVETQRRSPGEAVQVGGKG